MRLKESNKETENPLDNKKTKAKQIKKISKSEEDKIQIKFQAEDGIRDRSPSRGLGDVYKRQVKNVLHAMVPDM